MPTPTDKPFALLGVPSFGEVPAETLEKFGPSALYTLAKSSVPASVRDSAIRSATENGRRFSDKDVKELIGVAVDDEPRPRRPKTSSPQQEREQPAVVYVPPAVDNLLEMLAAKAIQKFTEDGASVQVSRLQDKEEDSPISRPWFCRVYRPGEEPEVFVSKECALSAITLAAGTQPERSCKECGQSYPLYEGFSRRESEPLGRSAKCRKCETERVGLEKKIKRGTLKRTPEEDEAKREQVRDHLTRHPDDTADKRIGELCGCSAQLVEKVRKEMGIASKSDIEQEAREAVRRELLADPNRSHPVIGELAGCHWTTARRIRIEMEEANEIPRATTRTGVDGVTMQVLDLPDTEVRPVVDLATELEAVA